MVVENPKGSRLFLFPPIAEAMRCVGAMSISTHLGSFGCDLAKPLTLMGTASFLPSLRRERPATRGSCVVLLFL